MPNQNNNSSNEARLSLMLGALFAAMILGPIFDQFPSIKLTLNILVSLIFISGVYAVARNRVIAILATLSAIPMILFLWQDNLPSLFDMHIAGPIATIIFSGLVIRSVYYQIAHTRRVSGHTIKGALTIYLLMGFAWAMVHLLLYTYEPTGYNGIAPNYEGDLLSVFFYFSFVTLTTLGYGDISPALEIHRSFTMLEAIVGQIYLVVVVAWLVGMKVAQDLVRRENDKA